MSDRQCKCEVCDQLRYVRQHTADRYPHRRDLTLYERSHNLGQAGADVVLALLRALRVDRLVGLLSRRRS